MPRRILTAFILVALGFYESSIQISLILSDFFAKFLSVVPFTTTANLSIPIFYLIAGVLIYKKNNIGHYLACIGLTLKTVIIARYLINVNLEIFSTNDLISILQNGHARIKFGHITKNLLYLAFSFPILYILLKDIYQLKTNSQYSLAVSTIKYSEIWQSSWLVSLYILLIATTSSTSTSTILLFLSVIPIIFINRAIKNNTITMPANIIYYKINVISWYVIYSLTSIGIILIYLLGIAGLASQGAGQ